MKHITSTSFIRVIFFVCFIICSINVFSQTEIEVKTSENYFWAQYIGENEEEAKNGSRTELISEVTHEVKEQKKLNFQSDILIKGIGYLVFPRGPKIRTIAYVLKDYVKNIQDDNKLDVIQLQYTEKKSQNLLKPDTIVDHSVKVVVNKTDTNTIDSNKKQVKNDPVTDTKHLELEENTVNKSNVVDNPGTEKEIIDFIIKAENTAVISGVMKTLKYKGALNYGVFNTSTQFLERCYILVFDPENGKIRAFLNKGSENSRLDFLTKKNISDYLDFFKNMNIVWIQIY